MIIRCSFKDPDKMPDAVVDAFAPLEAPAGLTVDEWASIRRERALEAKHQITKKWMEYGEYLVVDFDTGTGTATVVPIKDQK